jgi:Na+/H+-translocating membrane pyrophosphatase
LVRGRDIAVFSDEPYCHMVWRGSHHSILSEPGMLAQSVGAYTFSKSYSMSGWRLGFAVASVEVADVIGKMINTTLSCTPPIVQLAGTAALTRDKKERDEVMLKFREKVVLLTEGLTVNVEKLSLLHAPFLLGLVTGGAVIYWFTGASTQAVTTGAYRAVEFIKANIRLEGVTKASVADSKKVVEICTQYAQKGMFNIFLTVFFSTLAFAFLEPYFFIGYLISIAIFGLYQALFMANAGGAWDNAKKLVETELHEKGTALHAACVVGDTVGDPFKDTAGPSLHVLVKLLATISLVLAPLFLR